MVDVQVGLLALFVRALGGPDESRADVAARLDQTFASGTLEERSELLETAELLWALTGAFPMLFCIFIGASAGALFGRQAALTTLLVGVPFLVFGAGVAFTLSVRQARGSDSPTALARMKPKGRDLLVPLALTAASMYALIHGQATDPGSWLS